MAQKLDAFVRVARDNLDRRIGLDVAREIPQFPVYADRNCGTRETFTDTGRYLGAGNRIVELAFGTIGQGNRRHF